MGPVPGGRLMPGGFQPYANKGARMQGPSLQAMLGGKPFLMPNPQDINRRTQKQAPSLLDLLLGPRR